jgi:hypothetical protein
MLDLKHTITINVCWNDISSIARAERDKLALENKGYILINHFGGLNESAMIYAKQETKQIKI